MDKNQPKASSSPPTTTTQTQTPISSVSGEEVQILLAKLNRASPYLPKTIPYQDMSSPHHDKQNKPPKHLLQLESMINHLEAHNLLQKNTTFIEFGCGTAKLSDCINERLQGESSHIVIDRQTFSNERKRDGTIVARSKYPHQIVRLTMDINDFHLETIPALPRPPVAVSKHLCGPAADATIQCLATQQTRIPLLVATCCHHSCQFNSFCNTDFVIHQLGFTTREFDILTILSAWASIYISPLSSTSTSTSTSSTLSSQLSLPLPPPSLTMTNHNEPFPPPLPMEPLPQYLPRTMTTTMVPSADFERTFHRSDKQQLGKRCKVLLDTARAHHLVSLGYSVRLVQYTSLSMENHLLIATPKND